MTRIGSVGLLAALVCGGIVLAKRLSKPTPGHILAAFEASRAYAPLVVQHPLNETLFPRDLAAPLFRWEDKSGAAGWVISFTFAGERKPMSFLSGTLEWVPPTDAWEQIKKLSIEHDVGVRILGWRPASKIEVLSRADLRIRTSNDEVGAPIFYREVILPFIEAVKEPSRIRWRFGAVSSTRRPPIVLEHVPVCGNCHSFPRDGRVLAMDVDYANTKGSYVITAVEPRMKLQPKDVITWDDYLRQDDTQTFGLLSQISPDGQLVISTVKDRSVFVPRDELAFSQLFFPIKGILVVYDRQNRTFKALPGADDPQCVQSNPSWSPDGKHVVFARAKAYELRNAPAKGKVLLSAEECEEFLKEGKPFQFDLYRVPYNGGQGGKPEPIEGASLDGSSNFFPRYSPDGKWIIFCKSKNYMLLQRDSELHIIPAGGGVARRLRCNLPLMNSWHSWSPNGRWLVFSSKAFSHYTQLFLTHIDDRGESTPPVLLHRFTASDRAANIPEFVNLPPNAIERIEARFLDDYSHARAGFVLERTGEMDKAIEEYRKALELNPANPHAHERLGYVLYNIKRDFKGGLDHSIEAVRLNPQNGRAHYNLGMALFHQNALDQSIPHLREAVRLLPNGDDLQYRPSDMLRNLGVALLSAGALQESASCLTEAVRIEPGNAEARNFLALALAQQGRIEEPLEQYTKATLLKTNLQEMPQLHDLIGFNLAKAGRFQEALESARKALAIANAASNQPLAAQIQDRIDSYKARRVPSAQ